MPITDVVRLSCDMCRETQDEVPSMLSIDDLQKAMTDRGWSVGNEVGPLDRWTVICAQCQEEEPWA